MEIIGTLIVAFGSIITIIGWIWLIILGFQRGGPLWGILIFLFSWLAGIVFCVKNKTGWIPLAMILIGSIIACIGVIPIVLKAIENAH